MLRLFWVVFGGREGAPLSVGGACVRRSQLLKGASEEQGAHICPKQNACGPRAKTGGSSSERTWRRRMIGCTWRATASSIACARATSPKPLDFIALISWHLKSASGSWRAGSLLRPIVWMVRRRSAAQRRRSAEHARRAPGVGALPRTVQASLHPLRPQHGIYYASSP